MPERRARLHLRDKGAKQDCLRSALSPLPTKSPQSTRPQRCFTLRQRFEASWSWLRSWSPQKIKQKRRPRRRPDLSSH